MPKNQINLLPQEDFEKKPLGKFLLWALSAGRWIVIVTELIVILAFLSRFKFDRDIADLYEQINQKQAIVQSSANFETEFRSFQKRLLEIKKWQNQKAPMTTIFTEVASLTPPEVVFTNFTLDEEGMKLTGNSLSEEGLGSFLNNLSHSPFFSEVNLGSVTKKPEETGFRFILSAKVKEGGIKNAL